MAEERLRCSRCHTAPWEWQETDLEVGPDGIPRIRYRDRPKPYEAELVRCKGCEELDKRTASISAATNRHGLYTVLIPTGK